MEMSKKRCMVPPTTKSKRRKMICTTCRGEFDSDYRKKHDEKYHGGKRQKIHDKDAPLNPFAASTSKRQLTSSATPSVVTTSSATPSVVNQSAADYPTKFPVRFFDKGKVARQFHPNWFEKFPWIHYSETKDKAYCKVCTEALKKGMLCSSKLENAFTKDGYHNWKNAMTKKKGFMKHEMSEGHKEAMERVIKIPSTSKDIGEILSSVHSENIRDNATILLKLLSSVKHLARQGQALRGNGINDNLTQLLLLRSEDDILLRSWLKEHREKYTSHDVQNEMLQLMSHEILREVVKDIKSSSFYSIMADETSDTSNQEQLVFCIRWVDDNLYAHEEFIGLHAIPATDAKTLTNTIRDILLRLDLSITRCRGQCYDGASSMTGRKSGVVAQIKEAEPRCLFTHCYGHAINLACADSVKNCKTMKDAMATAFEITKLIKLSPKREAKLANIIESSDVDDISPKLRLLCTTRWTVRASTINAVIQNYNSLLELWEWCLETTKDTEMRSRILGVQSEMHKFNFFFGLHLSKMLFYCCDNLSKTLQTSTISAAEGQEVARLTVMTIESMRNEEQFDLFWEKIISEASKNDVSQPCLPRQRKAPVRFEVGEGAPSFPTTPKDFYRRTYFEAIDLITSCIKDRFEQNDYSIYRKCEDLLVMAAKGIVEIEQSLTAVTDFFVGDFDAPLLLVQLQILHSTFDITSLERQKLTLHDVLDQIRSFSPTQRTLMSEVIKLAEMIVTMPATNATSERSFSCLRRLKTYLRNSMKQSRLNHLMILNIHKERTDQIQSSKIAQQFVSKSERRLSKFGSFL